MLPVRLTYGDLGDAEKLEKERTLMLRPIVTDWTCPVAVEQLWELTGSDRTLGSCVRSGVTGHVRSRVEPYWK